MSTYVLPTYTDVIKFYKLTKKYEIKHEMNQKDPSHFAIATNVCFMFLNKLTFYGRKRPFQILASAMITFTFAGAYVKKFVCFDFEL